MIRKARFGTLACLALCFVACANEQPTETDGELPTPESPAPAVDAAHPGAPDAAAATDAARADVANADVAKPPALDAVAPETSVDSSGPLTELDADVVKDKIRGGLLGHLLGDLNGLAHEMKYIHDPGNVTSYTPSLSGGAWTDDDTDFEWVYVVAMQEKGKVLLGPDEIATEWKAHINRYFWCANQYARQLMDLGMVTPRTGQVHVNPWSDFNISGQFVSESFGMIAPGMPETAARTGLNYTHTSIEGEPAQTTQLFDAMLATAFLTSDLDAILDAGLAAVDPASMIHEIVTNVRKWHAENPDWHTTRTLVRDTYTLHGGSQADNNGHALNTAGVIGALVYGEGDFVKTIMTAFNFGWDADNNAATAGAIVGVLKGSAWILSQGWDIKDEYRNTSRDGMPAGETITSFGDRLVALAERVITENGGSKVSRGGKDYYSIRTQAATNVEKVPDLAAEAAALSTDLRAEIESGVRQTASSQEQARSAYLAIALGLGETLRAQYPTEWAAALAALNGYPKVVGVLFFQAATPAGDKLRTRALAAGLTQPATQPTIW